MTAKQTNCKKKLNSFKTELHNSKTDSVKYTLNIDGEAMNKINFLMKKYNYRTMSKLLRDLINTYYNDIINNTKD